jgi:hypothetical protein
VAVEKIFMEEVAMIAAVKENMIAVVRKNMTLVVKKEDQVVEF